MAVNMITTGTGGLLIVDVASEHMSSVWVCSFCLNKVCLRAFLKAGKCPVWTSCEMMGFISLCLPNMCAKSKVQICLASKLQIQRDRWFGNTGRSSHFFAHCTLCMQVNDAAVVEYLLTELFNKRSFVSWVRQAKCFNGIWIFSWAVHDSGAKHTWPWMSEAD